MYRNVFFVRKMTRWLVGVLTALTLCYLSLIFMDVNDRHNTWSVGEFGAEQQHCVVKSFLPVIQVREFCVVLCYFDFGPSRYDWRGKKMFDRCLIPSGFCPHIRACHMKLRTEKGLRLHYSCCPFGYVPMWYTLEMSDCVLRVPYPDRNVRAWGLMRGTNCAEFIDVVDKELAERAFEVEIAEGNPNSINYVICTAHNKFKNHSESLDHTGDPPFQAQKLCSRFAERRFINGRLDLCEETHEVTRACIRILRGLRKRNSQSGQEMVWCSGVAGQTRDSRCVCRINRLLAGMSRGALGRCYRVVHLCAEVYEGQVRVMLSRAEGGCRVVRVKVDAHPEIVFRDRPVPFARQGAQSRPRVESDLHEMSRLHFGSVVCSPIHCVKLIMFCFFCVLKGCMRMGEGLPAGNLPAAPAQRSEGSPFMAEPAKCGPAS